MNQQLTPEEMNLTEKGFYENLEVKFPKKQYPELWFYISKNLIFYQGSLALNSVEELVNLPHEDDRDRFKEFLSSFHLLPVKDSE